MTQVQPRAGAGAGAGEATRERNPLNGVRPDGSDTTYVQAGVEGTLPAVGGAVVVELAPAGRRFGAALIDLVVAGASLVVPLMGGTALQNAVAPDGGGYWNLLGLWLGGFVWLTLYGTAFVALCGGTPGLLVTGLRIARVWHGHERPTWQEAFKRARFVAITCWLVPVVNAITVLVRLAHLVQDRPYHHSTLDTFASTVVVRR